MNMTSYKRPRQKNLNRRMILQNRRQTSTLFISVITLVQLFAAPVTVKSFAFTPKTANRCPHTNSRTFDSLSFVLHTHNKNGYGDGYQERNISSNSNHTNRNQKRSRKEIHEELFQAYHTYKETQSSIDQLGLTHATLDQQAERLHKSPSQLEQILTDGQNARQNLLLDNTPLVHNTVYKLTKSRRSSKSLINLSNEDLVQEGTIGLLRAIDKFDPSLGHAFSTYAVYWIRASVNRCIQSREEMIRVPEYLDRAIRLIDSVLDEEAVSQLDLLTGKSEVRLKRVMKLTGLSKSVVKEALKVKRRRMLQSGTSRGGYTMLEDYMMAGSYSRDAQMQQKQQQHLVSSDSQDIMREGQLEYVKDVLGEYLSMREIEALSWRYGLLQYEEPKAAEKQQPQQQEEVEIPRAMPNGARDYEAEAEEALFGPGTIFSPTMEVRKWSKPAKQTTTQVKAKATVSSGGRWGEAMSFKEVGEQMRVSAEYGRRLCSSALKKLQAAAEEGRLDPAMLF